jgi:hypothetical protein
MPRLPAQDLFDHEGAPFNGQRQGTLPAGTVEWMQAGRSTKGDHVPRQTLRYVPCSATMLVFGAVRWN